MNLACLALLLVVPVIAAGCGTTSANRHEEQTAAASDATDAQIEGSIDMLYQGTFHDGDARRVELTLRNKSQKRLECYFTVDWHDAAGKLLASGAGGWSKLSLDPGASQPIRIQSMPKDAAGWHLRFSSTGAVR